MTRKKVLIVMGPIIRGGAELQVFEIVRHLDHDKFDPIICSVSYKPSIMLNNELVERSLQDVDLYHRFKDLGITLYELNRYSVYDLRGVKQIAEIVRHEQIDLIHVNLVIWGQLAGLLTKIPTIPHVRSELEWPDIPRLAYWGNYATHRWFKVVIAVSEAVKSQVVSRWHVKAERIQVVHSGIDLSRFNPDQVQGVTELRQSLGIKPDEKIIIRVANAREAKGLSDYVDLAAIICQQRSDIRFLLVGDGELLPQLKYQAQKLDLGDRLLFLGRRGNVPQLLAMSDVFVSTSLKEASPGSMKEAMAIRLPVVATDVGGHPEIIKEAYNGFLVPSKNPHAMAEKVNWLLNHSAEAQTMGQNGRKIVAAQFTNQHMVKGVERAYSTALSMS
ncbi:MAG: N-acetyl-alpha-D-glucosaminyl L-malate synthase [Anaerolineae bacterium]|nr:N-acetyl-alpha-D-glucosaminyl L-malate synthase [Anaerolineae bacterium]